MKRATIRCPYCGAQAKLHPGSFVYGPSAKPGSLLYVCDRYPACDAYVGAHQNSKLPMGTLANGDLRHKRIEAHRSLNWLWRSGLMTKGQAYKWLQAKLGLSKKQTHIAKFSDYLCDQVILVCEEARKNHKAVQKETVAKDVPSKRFPKENSRGTSLVGASGHP